MKNIKNTKEYSIVLGLKILSVLAFGVMLIPLAAHADYGTNYNYGTFNGYNQDYNGNSIPPANTPPAYITEPIVYTNVVHNTTTVKKTAPANTSGVTYIAVPAGSTIVNSVPAGATVVSGTTTTTTPDTYSSLGASAIVGSSGFLPSGIIQWILLAIFILLIVILVRKIFGGEKRYQETPLKHA